MHRIDQDYLSYELHYIQQAGADPCPQATLVPTPGKEIWQRIVT